MKHTLKVTLLTTVLAFNAIAADKAPATNQAQVKPAATTSAEQDEANVYQKVVEDFKKYMLTVKPEVKEEITQFKQKIKELNEQKSTAYAKLTAEAQAYLKNERAFKKKLPINQRKDLIKEIQNITPQNKEEAKPASK